MNNLKHFCSSQVETIWSVDNTPIVRCDSLWFSVLLWPWVILFIKLPCFSTLEDVLPITGVHASSVTLDKVTARFGVDNIPGKTMFYAGMLSRATLQDEETEKLFNNELNVCCVQATPQRLASLRAATAEDPTLQSVIGMLNDKHSIITQERKPFMGFKDELSYEDGLLFKGNRLVIP
ncbi:hypothetical protein CAPTEDRAFT_191379 [Capitella teleta]|uniref:Uncharacterized protein n=1 Tax=Capitella teleta TaxID=283909 RepID=R7UGU2_CAPTE|nr:hypothetical protein CAPTEDRAFT_191379 [Capitella teleta]|eukprot:ELU02477.1 hypothetical protein CAPTEDRAFT_191379 [Capitella teleta]